MPEQALPEDATLSFSKDRRRRTAACLKACEGIPTGTLERGILLRLIAACIHVRDRRIREILDELVRDSGEVEGPTARPMPLPNRRRR
jgi:hypothetical protein